MITLKVKTRTGQIMYPQYEEILEIDGVPFRGTSEDMAQIVTDHETRLLQLETMLGQALGGRINGGN